MAGRKPKDERTQRIQVRLSIGEKMKILSKAEEFGFKEPTEYARYVMLNAEKPVVEIKENDS